MSHLFTERRVISVVLLVLTLGLLASTFGRQFADLGGAFSPMFFPKIILMILLGLGLLNVVLDFRAQPEGKAIELRPVVIISGAFVAYVLLLVPLGYFISSIGMGAVILLALGLRNPVQIVMVPLIGAGSLIVLFNHILKMPLPSSPFVWWL